MASIFDLKTSVSELAASNAGVARNNFEQYAPLREVGEKTFSQGQINFRFETTGTKWWVPNKSYFRVRCKLTDGNKQSLSLSKSIAPNLNLMNNLFQSAELQINNRTVSKITDFMGPISALETRLSKSKQFKEIVAKNNNLMTPSFSERQQYVCKDGYKECEETWSWVRMDKLGYVAGDLDSAINYDKTVRANITTLDDVKSKGIIFSELKEAGTGVNNGGGIAAGTNTLSTFKVGDKFRLVKVTDGKSYVSEGNVVSVGFTSTGTSNTQEIIVDTIAVDDGGLDFYTTNGSYDTESIYFMRGRREECALKATEFELIWTPPLSIFKLPHAIPPGARVDIFLNPHNENIYKYMAVETLPPYKAITNEYDFAVTGMFLYVNTLEGARVENLTYLLDLESTVVFSENISSNEFSQKNFDVPTSTYALTLAYQDREATSGNTIFSPSKFHVGYNGLEKYIDRFYISYAGQQLPQPDADPSWNETTNSKLLTQRWAESLRYSNGCYDPVPTESFSEWLEYGPFFHFAWPRDAADRSTRVQIFQKFNTTKAKDDNLYNDGTTKFSKIPVDSSYTGNAEAYVTNMTDMSQRGNMLLFAHYREVAKITIQDSRVTNVELEIA